MNADRLLTLYDRVADAPNAIPRLRRFVLDLAVRGKLVAQDPNDEPASELLKRIVLEKTRLTKAKEIRKEKPIPRILEDNVPFPLPAGWSWSQIAEIGIVNPRNSMDDEKESSFVPMSLIPAQYGQPVRFEVKRWREIKKGYSHFAENDVGLAKITPCFENGKSAVFTNLTGGFGSGTTELYVVRPIFANSNYIVLFFKCPHFIHTGVSKMTGTAGQKRLPREYFSYSPFPLPPLAEQHRIVTRVDELMAVCDRLEAVRVEREEARNRFAAASLARLRSPDPNPGVFREQAAFALDNLAPLATRPDQIPALRQTIFDLAVRGKLVAQDSSDEPASKLLKRIEVEKKKAPKISKSRSGTLSARPSDKNILDLPIGWERIPLYKISNVTMGQSPPGNTYNKSGNGVPLINGPSEFTLGPFGRTIVNQFTTSPTNFCEQEDFLICVRGSTTGRTNVAAFRACIGRGVAAIRSSFDDSFIRLFIWSVRENIISMGRGIAFPSISKKQLENLSIPLPPLAEQHRIVARVDELMAVCDRLEKALVVGDEARSRLLDALLHEALEASGVGKIQQVPG